MRRFNWPNFFIVLIVAIWILSLIMFFTAPCDAWIWDIVPIGEIPGRCL